MQEVKYIVLENSGSKAALLIREGCLKYICLKRFFIFKPSARQVPFTDGTRSLQVCLKPPTVCLGSRTQVGNSSDFSPGPDHINLNSLGKVSDSSASSIRVSPS